MNKDKYIEAMKSIEISPETKRRILTKSIKSKQNKERYTMISKKKFGLIAVAATMILGATAFAASGIISSWFSSSSSIPDYNTLPTAAQTINDVGYTPILIEKFDNGYTFDSGHIVENVFEDDSNNSVESFKSFYFQYTKNRDVVTLSQAKYNSEISQDGTLVSSKNGNNIYFSAYTNKIVPPNYELTEEDKIAEQNGELVFSYGSDEISVSEIVAVFWNTDDMYFQLLQIDGNLSADDLVEMADYIISQY